MDTQTNFIDELKALLNKYEKPQERLETWKYIDVELRPYGEFPEIQGCSDSSMTPYKSNRAIYRLVSEGETVVRNAGVVGKTFLDPITGEPVETFTPSREPYGLNKEKGYMGTFAEVSVDNEDLED